MAGALKAALLLALLLAPWQARAAAPTLEEIARLAFVQHPGARLDGAARLRDETGRDIALATLVADRPAVLVLDYLHCPNLCGLVLGGLADALAQAGLVAGRDYRVLALSIDPDQTPADAARARADYAARYPDEVAAWHFLTGDATTVRSLADTVGFPYRWDETIRQFAHPAGLTLLAPGGRVASYLLGLAPTGDQLRRGLAQAAAGEVAAPASRLLLLCFGYDPASGRYDVTVMRATRLVALGGVGLLALLIGGLVRAERRRR